MVEYPISSQRIFIFAAGVCDEPGKYRNLITNCVINRLMAILLSFQSRNFIRLNKSIH